jgi:pantoate--beta-alanine ligase
MEVVTQINDLRKIRSTLAEPVGFVPTMGFLHEGHLSLVRTARGECASVVVSIFVNPTQFGPNEDLAKYPRDMDRDLQLLQSESVDLVWTPDDAVMYPVGYQTWVTVEGLTQPLEGAQRPGHFRGVTTVVSKLFNAVQPQKAYFGQKDAQQARVIQQMALDLNFPIEIVVCPTVREPDGLAMSSRNAYLNPEQRKAATVLYKSIKAVEKTSQQGERDANELREIVKKIISSEPLARLEYVSCTDPQTFKELDRVEGKALLSMAVYIGKTRLIDNIVLGGVL